LSSGETIEISEYEDFPAPIEISIKNLDNFYSEFKDKFEITPTFEFYKNIKKKIKEDHRYNGKNNKFKLNLKSRYYIGIIKLPNNKTVIIKPKISNDVKFLHMFEYVDPQYAKIFFDITQKITPESNFLTLLIERFISLAERLLRRTLVKNYTPVLSRSNKIRGKLCQRDTIKNPIFLKGKVVCVFDDFVPDILENQIVKFALFQLKFIAGQKYQARIHNLLIKMGDISLKQIKIEDIDKIKYNHLNIHYKNVHNYCRMIIGRFSFGFELGKHEWFSMLLNSWDIYERFLRKIMEKYLKEKLGPDLSIEKKGIKPKPWDKNKLFPDIIIRKDDEVLLLCDAKYKLEYEIKDIYQAAYYIRLFSKRNEKGDLKFEEKNRNFVLIYPTNEKSNYNSKPLEEKSYKFGTVFAHSIDLSQIDNKNYLKSWFKKMIKTFLI